MSEYFRNFIKKENYPFHYSGIKFKTFFVNCIQQAMSKRDYKQTEEDDWNIYWCEKEFIPETLDKIRLFPDRRINHFRNYYEICRKDLLSKNVKRYKKGLEREGKNQEAATYDYLPLTYNLPSEYPIFLEEFKRCKDKEKITWIMKPIGKSQGKGIFLFKHISEISEWADQANQPQAYIVQRYIHNPLLIGHKKFDMRIYVLATSHNPLILYLYRSGFGRFTHYRYDANDIYNNEIHLTNVAIQKHSDNYDEQRGGKYLLDKLKLYILSKYGEEEAEKCFFEIQQLIIKTFLATSKIIINDKRCFELYGFDIMIDANLKPWLIEVNGSPSMTANTPQDRILKIGLLDDTLTIVNLQKLLTGDEEQVGGFNLIYKAKKIAQKVKNVVKNISFLGCLNDRIPQMRKLAKNMALVLAEKAKEEKPKEERNTKNRSIMNPAQNYSRGLSTNPSTNGPKPPYSSKTKVEVGNSVKLPKVSSTVTSNVGSNNSMKAIGDTNQGKKISEGLTTFMKDSRQK